MATDDNAVSEQNKQQNAAGQDIEKMAGTDPSAQPATDTPADPAKSDDDSDDAAQLKEQLQKAEEKAASHWEEVLRARAELENTRRRLERDVENAHKYAVDKFLQDLLPVIDSLEMGINAARESNADIAKVKEGTELTLKMLTDCTQKFGIQAISPVGEPFDPEFHQAMSIVEDNQYPPDTVTAVMQKGYLLNGRLVRPAMVVVSKAAPGGASPDNNGDDSNVDNNNDNDSGGESAKQPSQDGKAGKKD